MSTLFFISLIIFVLGVAAATLRYGVPASVSEVYYLLPAKWRLAAFYGWMLGVSAPLMVFWLDVSEGTFQAPVFFGCVLLAFVGVAAPFRESAQVRRVHVVCTVACVLCSQAWIALYTPFWVFSVALGLLLGAVGLKTTGVSGDGRRRAATLFFLELAAFVSVYIAVCNRITEFS